MEINVLTHKVIGCAYKVHNTLGFGFLEKVYENALRVELKSRAFMFANNPNSRSSMKGNKWGFTSLIFGSMTG